MGVPSYVWGVLLAISAGIINAFGVIKQKQVHMEQNSLEVKDRISYVSNPKWWLGFLTYIGGNLLNAVALTMGSQSIISPLTSINLVANTLLAPMFLDEILTRGDVLATFCIIIGCVIIVAFGDHDSTNYEMSDLLKFFQRNEFIIYVSVGSFLLIVIYIVSKVFHHEVSSWTVFLDEFQNSETTLTDDSKKKTAYFVFLDSLSSIFNETSAPLPVSNFSTDHVELLTSMINYRAKFLAISYAVIAGSLSSINILMTKCIGELVSVSFNSKNQFVYPLTYVFVAVLVVCNTCEIYWMQRALQEFEALIVVPMFQCSFSVLSILTGAVYFNEISTFNALQFGMFPVGVLVTLIGIYLLSQREATVELNRIEKCDSLSEFHTNSTSRSTLLPAFSAERCEVVSTLSVPPDAFKLKKKSSTISNTLAEMLMLNTDFVVKSPKFRDSFSSFNHLDVPLLPNEAD